MEKFYRKNIKRSDFSESDTGIKVEELIELLNGHELRNQILDNINIKEYLDDFIAIPGSRTLVNTQKYINSRFYKEDLKSKLKDVSIYKDDDFTINFKNLTRSDYLAAKTDSKVLSTEPIYSSQRDFFAELLGMDKYAGNLIKGNHKDLVSYNLQAVQSLLKDKAKKFRILHDTKDNTFYLRAIISTGNYFNYDNNVAIVIALFALHLDMVENLTIYSLNKCEYNESFIRIFFESNAIKELANIGHVKNLVEISNDEIKREALKFSGICSIVFGKNDEKELFIQPKEIKSKVFSIKHNQIPKNAVAELTNFEKINDIHNVIFKDIAKISTIKQPDQIKYLIRDKVENAKNQDIKKYKFDILNELKNNIDNIIKLLEMLHKIQLLAEEDINAVEYIRYVFYQALIERK